LCGEALLSNENKLVTTAATSLTNDGHVEGEKLLVAAFEKQKGTPFSRILINALANFATPTARAALIRMRDIVDLKEKDEINRALALLSSRSPGFQFASQGWNHYVNKQFKEANEAYDIAIQLDPVLAEAYLLRGKLFLTREDYGRARKDFEKVLELKFEPKDAEFSEFVTSLAIARVVDGDLAEGLKYLEENRIEGVRRSQEKGAKGLFHYNAACAYSRAVEQVDKRPDLADRATIREKYRRQAIDDLTESFNEGFNDYDHTANDPDFKYLHDDPDFKKILANKPNVKPEDNPTDDDDE
jgi:tetratricopeptide (TPR) repeat protein